MPALAGMSRVVSGGVSHGRRHPREYSRMPQAMTPAAYVVRRIREISYIPQHTAHSPQLKPKTLHLIIKLYNSINVPKISINKEITIKLIRNRVVIMLL